MRISLRILFWSLVSQLGLIHVIVGTFFLSFILYLICDIWIL